MRILVTGSTGFVGTLLCAELMKLEHIVHATSRKQSHTEINSENIISFPIDEIDAHNNWKDALDNCDVVIHLAARVHVIQDKSSVSLAEFRKVNVEGTLNLALQAATSNIKRFIFISSVKVNGDITDNRHPFSPDDIPNPQDTYGLSKQEAEEGLLEISAKTGMEVVIIRPPLIYGPGVKANFATMLYWLDKGVPLPLGAITKNRRSLVSIDNLIDLLIVCLEHPAAANQIFMISDGHDLSTARMLEKLSEAMDKPANLFSVPPLLLKLGSSLICRNDLSRRLLCSLQVDITKTSGLLNWEPPQSIDKGFRKTAAFYNLQRPES